MAPRIRNALQYSVVERERERARERCEYIYIYICVYIERDIYIYIERERDIHKFVTTATVRESAVSSAELPWENTFLQKYCKILVNELVNFHCKIGFGKIQKRFAKVYQILQNVAIRVYITTTCKIPWYVGVAKCKMLQAKGYQILQNVAIRVYITTTCNIPWYVGVAKCKMLQAKGHQILQNVAIRVCITTTNAKLLLLLPGN